MYFSAKDMEINNSCHSIFSATPIVNGTSNLPNAVLSPSLVDDMKALSLGATTNGPTPVVQNVSR